MTLSRFVLPLLVLVVGSVGPTCNRAVASPPQPQGYGQQGGWDVPPNEFNDLQRRGFHDGIEGARKDFGNHRNPDVNNRDEYRDPDLPREQREIYRDAFRRGYQQAASHLWGGPPVEQAPPPMQRPPDRDDWAMRGLLSEAERHGYNDGMEEARRDARFNRPLDPDNHDDYRNPNVPPPAVEEYREGYMRGYEVAVSQLNGEPAWQDRGDPSNWTAPQQFNEIQRRGFHDGIEGARKDFGNHRRPNPNNRNEYRDPRLPSELVSDYREGYRRGYELTVTQLCGGH
jgi:hypothetical protein